MSMATKFETLWNARGGVIPKDYQELTALVITIDRHFDVRVKHDPPAMMITFSDGSVVKLEVNEEPITKH